MLVLERRSFKRNCCLSPLLLFCISLARRDSFSTTMVAICAENLPWVNVHFHKKPPLIHVLELNDRIRRAFFLGWNPSGRHLPRNINSTDNKRVGHQKKAVLNIGNRNQRLRITRSCLQFCCFSWQSRELSPASEVTVSRLYLGYIARAWHWQLVGLNWASTTWRRVS